MNELIRRFQARPHLTAELVVGTLFINVLALAQPLFVSQVLNRYVGQGVDSTLYTLVSGVVIAMALEFIFRQNRMRIATVVGAGRDAKLAVQAFSALTRAQMGALEQMPAEMRRGAVGGAAAVENAYAPANVTAILDVPFALVFLVVLYLIKPSLAAIVLGFVIMVLLFGIASSLAMDERSGVLQKAVGESNTLLGTAIREAEMVRAFNAGSFLRAAWDGSVGRTQGLRRVVAVHQGLVQTVTQSVNGLMSVVVIAYGAMLAVQGELDVGILIGANILASRALQPISRFSQLGVTLSKARRALDGLKELGRMPLEADSGTALRTFNGAIELRDVAFGYPGTPLPLFESLSLRLEPGAVLLVTGTNGTGKTTLARLLVGLLDPVRGQILVDGIDLKQIAPEWWRRQIIYLPQEPSLLNGTIEDNLRINNPNADPAQIDSAVSLCGLRRFIDESQQGLQTAVTDNGLRLAVGIRRRIALARATMTNGKVAIIDEPTDGFDAEGRSAFYALLAKLAETGRTIIVISHEQDIVRGGHIRVDLNTKPTPTVTRAGM